MDVALTDYRAALDALYARLTGATKFGLERTEALLNALGDPHRRLRAFHVAGTNGKGSVVATLDALLRARGLRTGRYTSPHLIDFRERFVIDGRAITEEAVHEWLARWMPTIEKLGATFFEATTALAFWWFAEQHVDVAVIETGLGGRLDSTNVIDPVVAGVTSIGLDHTDVLGDTLEAIAREKAGIFKRNRPAVIGEPDARIAHLLRHHAVDAGASRAIVLDDVLRVNDVSVSADGTSFRIESWDSDVLKTPLIGAHQARNASVALLMAAAAGKDFWPPMPTVQAALRSVHLAGRFQREGNWVFDVAHNPAGASVLATSLREAGIARPISAVLCVLGDKDWRGIMDALAPAIDRFILTDAPTVPAARAWSAQEALAYARERGYGATHEPDLDRALALAHESGASALVTGSFHTVGDAMSCLKIDPLAG